MQQSFYVISMNNIFSNNDQISFVSSFPELVHSHFKGNMNAICWFRNLVGDFKEIVDKLELDENIIEPFLSFLKFFFNLYGYVFKVKMNGHNRYIYFGTLQVIFIIDR